MNCIRWAMSQQHSFFNIGQIKGGHFRTASLWCIHASPRPIGTSHKVIAEQRDSMLRHLLYQACHRGNLGTIVDSDL